MEHPAQGVHTLCSVLLDQLEPVSAQRYQPPPACRSAHDGCTVLGQCVRKKGSLVFSYSFLTLWMGPGMDGFFFCYWTLFCKPGTMDVSL